MRPLDQFDQSHDDCLVDNHDDGHDSDAPVSALTPELSFWDHLGATRADEYAQDDILTGIPLPDVPVPEPTLLSRVDMAPPQSMPQHGFTRLDETLRAQEATADPARPAPPQIPLRADMRGPGGPAGLPPAQPTARREPHAPPRGPAAKNRRKAARQPSRFSYRIQRLWLTPLYRRAIKIGLPVAASVVAIVATLASEDRRMAIVAQGDAVYSAFVDRPDFMVTELRLPDLAPELEDAIRTAISPELPKSSWRLDLEDLRARIEVLDAIRVADLRLLPDGVLAVAVTERVPAILWRSSDGLEVLDIEGKRIGFAPDRHILPDLPVIAGEGGGAHVIEALDLFEAASPLGARVRGLVRVGERRWDVVLDREQRIKLPETGAIAALEHVIALEQAQDLLSRDLIAADMRNPGRPILQISEGAMETIRAIRSQNTEALQ
ncbi:cell division protein FtsQ/DivIB [Roseinatronobacter alkalisoli]|uniref:Cell division protein FtsQ n=1 Tax=Roseinatronobacter alkalisoli TaxID=3028235 RepID=A0ABT5T4N7_9RHOB|nr:cell division protein FtsQ/DivIB [Roseinatronobacter sp. HJB301]MDD7970075.1 cell division protein FtsQ/DivIB [Roseinatronobacter sp. HJB301]